jgi:hypothetical protein
MHNHAATSSAITYVHNENALSMLLHSKHAYEAMGTSNDTDVVKTCEEVDSMMMMIGIYGTTQSV